MKVRDLFEGLKQLPGETDEKFQERRDADYVKRGGKSVPAYQVNQQRGARNKDEVRKSYSDDMKNMNVREASMSAYELGYDHGNRYNAVKKNPYDEGSKEYRDYVKGYAEGDSDWWEEEKRSDQRD